LGAGAAVVRPRRPTFVVGGAHSPYVGKGHPNFVGKEARDLGVGSNPSIEDHITTAVCGALASTYSEPDAVARAVERGYIGNFLGELFCRQGLLGSAVSGAHPELDGKPFVRTEAACASGGAAIVGCIDAISAGYDVTLAVGAEVECTTGGREGAEYMARACHYPTERGLDDFIFPYLFAVRARAYKQAHGATHDDLDQVVLRAYANANRNPLAHMHATRLTSEQLGSRANRTFLQDPELRPHMKLYDCTHFSDGASAILLASEEGLNRLGVPRSSCTEVLSYGAATAPLDGYKDPLQMPTMARAASEAFRDAGVRPADMGVAELHDCFSIAELMVCEAIGLADPGGAVDLIRSGATHSEGRIPVNTGGGLIGFGHPVGATGVKQVLEVHRQMRGLCRDYQLPTTPDLGVSANLGGDDRTAVVMVQRTV
jgi:acetyl-CoA acetyltransferase